MTRLVVLVCAGLLALAIACGSDDSSGDDDPSPAAPSPTVELARTPVEQALLDEVIALASQLGTMTEPQATCVFRDHPSIYHEFLQETGLDRSGNLSEATLREQFEVLKRDYAVQLGRCFNGQPGG